jgi:ATP-dependent DNA ligase
LINFVDIPGVAEALANLPEETVVVPEVVALDEAGKPSFKALQNYCSAKATLVFTSSTLLILSGRDLRAERLETRRELLENKVLPPRKRQLCHSVEVVTNPHGKTLFLCSPLRRSPSP